MATPSEKQGITGGTALIIIGIIIAMVMVWSYTTDGDLNPFDDRTVASADIGDTKLSITEDGDESSFELDVE